MSPKSYFHDKVIIITGASSGIGKATAEVFGRAGARLLLAARNEQMLNEVVQALKMEKITAIGIKTDVSIEADCKNLIQAAIDNFGQIDILINNAGISMRALFEDVSLDVLKHLMDVNFWGTVYCTKFALPFLLNSGGSLVGISSIAGKKGLPARTGYSASKFAMEGFLESLRIENLEKGLQVLCVCPGFTASNIRNAALSADGKPQEKSPRDEGRMMPADEVAARILKAVQGRKRDLILTGNGLITVWLDKFMPALMDKMVFRHLSKEDNSPFK
jgi:dehydrogenase/reductase SDR family protein 7B